jgi:hypothetical protein
MIGCQKDELQVLASFISSGRFLPLQKILHEGRLVCGKTLTPSAEVQKGVTVFDEYRPQFSGRIRYCESAGMSGIGIAGTVDKQNCRSGRRGCGLPEKSFKPQTSTGDYNDLGIS